MLRLISTLAALGRFSGSFFGSSNSPLQLYAKPFAMRRPSKGLIHHSDRGSQYCSIDYQAELRRHDVCISISEKGNCYDNAMVETFFKTLKSELVWRPVSIRVPKRKPPLPAIIDGFYNPTR